MSMVETIRFHLRDGVADADFIPLNEKVDQYMATRPGFQSRETLHGDDGEWLIVVHWSSPEEAEPTISGFFSAPETQEFIAAVDPSTTSHGRYHVENLRN